jgi:predicted TIM-barrel fold metal-dependent hydrolase
MIGPLSLQGGDTKVIIDCHWHVLFDDYERVIQTSINELKRCGMDRCTLMFHLDLYQKEGDLHRQGEALKKVLKDRKEYFVPFLTVDPNVDFGIVKEGVEEYVVKGPAVAVKVHHSMKADRKEFEPLANLLSMHGIPVLIHCWYKTVQKYENESDPSNIANLAAKFPDLKIIMAHITGCGFRGIQDIAPYPNVYVDTSGSQPEDGIMQYGLDLLGADRILFGSDFPGRDPATQLGRIYSLDMSEEDRNKILGGNSVRLFGGAF